VGKGGRPFDDREEVAEWMRNNQISKGK